MAAGSRSGRRSVDTAINLHHAIRAPISSHSFKVEQETVINRYVKSGAPRPARRVENWYSRNSGFSRDFVAGVKGHEYKGIGGNATGHYGLIEKALAQDDNNVSKIMERQFLNGTEENFKAAVNGILVETETRLHDAAREHNVSGNFAERNDYSFFNAATNAWSPKTSWWRAL